MRFVSEKGIKNVFFLDKTPKDEIPFVLSGADGIFVSESDFSKGFFPEQENFVRFQVEGNCGFVGKIQFVRINDGPEIFSGKAGESD